MPATAILFDLDGTLVDTAPDLAAAVDFALTRHGRPAMGLATVRDMVGDGARALVERGLLASGGIPSPDFFEAAVDSFMAYYESHLVDTSRPFPGVTDCLDRLRQADSRLAVCTNKAERFSRTLLEQLGLAGRFGAIVGGDTLPMRKPDPGHIAGTLAQLGTPVKWAAMVGDSANDVNAAKAAGIPVVAVSFGYTRIPVHDLGADVVIDHFDQLPDALASLGWPGR